ncbi:MAG: hypothetical protein HZC36_07630 [Armatimonadetes bacterium]|nr:hypothetical protein [Armatimonadota bacterium]
MYKVHFRRIAFFGVLGLIAGLVLSVLSPKIYEAQTGLIVGTSMRVGASSVPDDVANILYPGVAQDPMSESDLLRGQGVFFRALQNVADRRGDPGLVNKFQELYATYDVQNQRQVNLISNIAILSVKYTDPQLAADIANEIAVVYNETRRRTMNERVAKAVDYVNGNVSALQIKLKEADKALEDYRLKNRVAQWETAQGAVTNATFAFAKEVSDTMAGIGQLEGELQSDKRLLKDLSARHKSQVQTTRNPVVQQLEGYLTDLQKRRAELAGRYMDDAPAVRELDAAIQDIQGRLTRERTNNPDVIAGSLDNLDTVTEQVRLRVATNESRLKGLKRALTQQQQAAQVNENQKNSIILDSSAIRELERERAILEGSYSRYKSVAEELVTRENTAAAAAEVFFDAVPPREPVAPDAVKLTLICLVAGICLGTVYSFSLETMKVRIHTASQLHDLTGLPVVASMPILTRGTPRQRTMALAQGNKGPSEAFRYLAISLLASESSDLGSAVFTSVTGVNRAQPATEFAIASAKMGKRVLLVDCDFGDSLISSAFEMSDKSGVAEMLSKAALPSGDSDAIGYATKHSGLSVLPVGETGGSVVSDFGLTTLATLAAGLQERFDLVVYVVPACDGSSDAALIGSQVDQVFLVVSARRTPFRNIPMACELMKRAGAKEVGVVLAEATPGEEPFTGQAGRSAA